MPAQRRVRVRGFRLVVPLAASRAALAVLVWSAVGADAFGATPVIEHDPVRIAVRGQPVSLLAKVSVRSGSVKSVTLNYTQSTHGAPIKIAMEATAMGIYTATIPEDFISTARTIFYYIEAEGDGEEWSETSWYPVVVKDSSGERPRQEAERPVARTVETQPVAAPMQPVAPPAEDKKNWRTLALIGGGAAGIVVGAVAISGSGGGGGSSGGTPSTTADESLAGTYVGSVVLCFTPSGGSTSCSSSPTTILIDENGRVLSSDLAGGAQASGNLSGNTFTLVVPARRVNPVHEGNINFQGSVRGGNIAGTISGPVQTPVGTGEYSGTFTASRL